MRKGKWQNHLLAGLLSVTMILPAPAAYAKEVPKEQPGEGRKQQEMQPESGEWKEEIKDTAVQDPPEVQKAVEVQRAAAEDFSYTGLEDGTMEITRYKGAGGAVEIPGEIEGKSVTSIGNEAFIGCRGLESVKIPESVTSIKVSAFSGCRGLESIQIPGNVTSIGNLAFSECSGLKSIEITGSVTSIGDMPFSYCSGLTSIEIPGSITSIGYSVFKGCSGLGSIEIPESVTSIGEGAFSYCSGLKSIGIPGNVTSIGDDVFLGCSGLESIAVDPGNAVYDSRDGCNAVVETESNVLVCGCKNTRIPKSVTSIGEGAFYYCSGLKSIEIPRNVKSIGLRAFSECSGLTGIKLSEGITSIGEDAFSGCNGLTDIKIPDGVTNIGNWAFFDCSSLTSIEIPGSVTSIGEEAFDGCSSLTIYGKAGSYAETYAKEKDIPFIAEEPGEEPDPNQPHSHTYAETITPATTSKDGATTKKCSICGDTKKTTIAYPKTMILSAVKYTYNGKVKKPSVTVKGSNGKVASASNYTVSYLKECKNPGVYTVTVQFKNNYSGSVKKTFTIYPKGTPKRSIQTGRKPRA